MKKYGLMLMLLYLLTGCVGEDSFIEEAMPDCAVSFTSALVAVATKADPPSSCLVKDSPVQISAYLAPLVGVEAVDYAQSQLFTVADANGTLSSATDMLLTSKVRYNFYAYSPAIAFNADSKKTISVKQGYDFMIAQTLVTVSKDTPIPLPVMSRKCSLVQFLVRLAMGNVGLKNFTIGTGGLTLGGLTRTPVSYTLGDGNIKLDGVIKDGTATIPGSAFEAKTVGSQYLGSSIVLPKLSGELSLSLNLVLSKGPVLLNAVIPAIAFAPGCNYLYMVEINDDVIKVCLVLDWNNSTSGFALGAPNASIHVGSWGLTTYTTTTTAGATNTTVAVTSWVGNANWAAALGASTSGGTVKGWTETTPTSTTVGSSNVTTTNTGWNASTSNHTTGTGTSAGTVTPWNSTTQTTSTTAGSSNVTTTNTGWNASTSNHTTGTGTSAGTVTPWNSTTQTTSTTAGSSNVTSTATTWNTSSSTHTVGAGAGGGLVTPWGPTFTTVTGIGE